jgi:hypothetical protein
MEGPIEPMIAEQAYTPGDGTVTKFPMGPHPPAGSVFRKNSVPRTARPTRTRHSGHAAIRKRSGLIMPRNGNDRSGAGAYVGAQGRTSLAAAGPAAMVLPGIGVICSLLVVALVSWSARRALLKVVAENAS